MEEIRHTYHTQLDELRLSVVRLGLLANESIGAGTEALLEADLAAADRVISGDAQINELTHEIEERAYLLLALQQPMASDLRMVVAILRTIHELERTGDLMVNVAKTTRRLYPVQLAPQIRSLIERMGAQAGLQTRLAVEAFADGDTARGLALDDMDDVMDDLQRELFRTIFAVGQSDDSSLQQSVQIALVGRYFERIADHAVTIGQRVAYMVTGEVPGAEGSSAEGSSAEGSSAAEGVDAGPAGNGRSANEVSLD